MDFKPLNGTLAFFFCKQPDKKWGTKLLNITKDSPNSFPHEFNDSLSQHSWCVCNLSVLVRHLLWPYYPSVSLWVVWPVKQNSACHQQPCSWEGERSSWEASPDINITSIYQAGNCGKAKAGEKKQRQELVLNIRCRLQNEEVRSHLKVVNIDVRNAAPSLDFHF